MYFSYCLLSIWCINSLLLAIFRKIVSYFTLKRGQVVVESRDLPMQLLLEEELPMQLLPEEELPMQLLPEGELPMQLLLGEGVPMQPLLGEEELDTAEVTRICKHKTLKERTLESTIN